MNAFCDGIHRGRQIQASVGVEAGKIPAKGRLLGQIALLTAVMALGGCSWFGNDEPAFPPTSGGPSIAAVPNGLPGDSANADYTDQELRALLGSAPRPLPAPAQKPKAADVGAPGTQPDASASPATGNPPATSGTASPSTTPAVPAPDAATNDTNGYPDINTVPMQRPTPVPDNDPAPQQKPQSSSMLEMPLRTLMVQTAAGSSPVAPAPDLTPDQTAQVVMNSDDDMFSKPALPAYAGYDEMQKQPQSVPAQSIYRSPYAGSRQYGGVIYASQGGGGSQLVASPGGQQVGLVYFGIGSVQLGDLDRQVLRQIADLQRAYGGVIRIVGHASSRTENMTLDQHHKVNADIAEARARAVAQQLVRYGVKPLFVQIAGASDTQPLYPEFMPAGEAANRRAEVYLSSN